MLRKYKCLNWVRGSRFFINQSLLYTTKSIIKEENCKVLTVLTFALYANAALSSGVGGGCHSGKF